LRILHAIPGLDPRHGGPSHALVGLAGHQQQAGLSVTVLCATAPGDRPDMAEELRRQGVTVIEVGPCAGALGRHRDLRPAMRRAVSEADLCHVHCLWAQVNHEAARACRRAGVPYIFRPCGMLDPWTLAQSRLKKQLYMLLRLRRDLNHAAAIHYTTATERRLAEPVGLTPPTIVEPNGVDLAEFDSMPEPGTFRARYPEVGDRPIVLFLSRVHQKKGLDLLIPAFARARRGDAMLVIVGPDDRGYLATAEAMVAEHGLRRDVLFTGLLRGADRLAALADAELFALPSYQENFGVAVVEALAAGVPVIISDQVNIFQDIADAEVGAVVPTNVTALTSELERWLDDAALRQAAAARAIPFVHERYDWAQIARRWVDRYQGMLGEQGPAGPCSAADGNR
jgi:glycosyltransferase involved in cell wall biosynthesis